MRFTIITDVHLGPAPFYKNENRIMSHCAEELLRNKIAVLQGMDSPDLIMQLGDLIQDNLLQPNALEDTENFVKALSLFSEFKGRVQHVVGNHEPVNLTPKELAKLLGYKELFYSFDYQGYHFIVLFSEALVHANMTISPAQRDWLTQDLSQTQLPTLIFTHHSLADQDLQGNYWFEGEPDRCLIQDRSQIRTILSSSGKVKAVFNGHLHWNNLTIHDGIPYFTIQSIVENFRNDGTPSNTHALVEVTTEGVEVLIKGNNPVTYQYDFT